MYYLYYNIFMNTPEVWNRRRARLLQTGEEVHRFFNIGRIVGEYASLDYIRDSTQQRLLCYPTLLVEGPQPLHPSLLPFPLIRDGSLTHDGVDIREVPSGTKPLLRIAQSFDTPGSGAPQRAEIFRQAGYYVGQLWQLSRFHLPQDFNLEMLCYIPEDVGAVACIPPVEYAYTPNPRVVVDYVTEQLIQNGFAPDVEELAQEFIKGNQEATQGTIG